MLDLSIDCPDGRADISRILNTISCQKNAAGRPLLSVVAVKAEIGYPDLGFFLLARALGVNPGYDDRNFFTYELQRVHDFWKEVIPVPGESCILLYPLNVDKEK
jgi:hypothetical protein